MVGYRGADPHVGKLHRDHALGKSVQRGMQQCQNGVCVITGGPGTGKTTIINTMIDVFEVCGFRVAIAAPTGRAAKRISETSGRQAVTIHRLLEYYYSEDSDRMAFGKNEEDQLDSDVVIIDEMSMVDILLMDALTEAIAPGTRLILVGDADQLPFRRCGKCAAGHYRQRDDSYRTPHRDFPSGAGEHDRRQRAPDQPGRISVLQRKGKGFFHDAPQQRSSLYSKPSKSCAAEGFPSTTAIAIRCVTFRC